MANEKRLIDANAFREFLEQVRQDYREEDTLSSGFAACLIETVQDEYLALAPTVDAVEVVYCGECRFADTKDCPMSGSAGRVSASDFCSYGERKDNDN